MSFAVHLFDSGMHITTIRVYMSAIAFAHKIRGLPDPTSTFLFQKFMIGMKKSVPSRAKLHPVTLPMLRELIGLVQHLSTSPFTKLLIKTLMSVMYHGCFRISEIASSKFSNHAIQRNDLHFDVKPPRVEPEKISLTLRSFKHSGEQQTIELMPSDEKRLCPVRLIWQFLQIRLECPYFFCDETGKPVTRTFLMQWLRLLVSKSSFSQKRISTHSFRVGRTTDLVLQGASDAYIRHVGRWSSNAYLKYVRSVVVL